MNTIEKIVAGAAAAIVALTLVYGIATLFKPESDDFSPAVELVSHNNVVAGTQN